MQSQNQFEPEWVEKHKTTTKRLSHCVELQEFFMARRKGPYLSVPLVAWARGLDERGLHAQPSL